MSNRTKMSRREFTGAAILATAAAALPAELLAQSEKTPTPVKPPQSPAEAPELPAAARAEAEQSYQSLLQKYGARFSDEQKKDIQRLVLQQQKSIEAVRAFSLENGDEPATVLQLVREVK